MPAVRVDMWKGRTEVEKAMLIKGITTAFVEIGNQAEWVTVILNEVSSENGYSWKTGVNEILAEYRRFLLTH